MRYTAYNLNIDSDLALPDLLDDHEEKAADVRIRFGCISQEDLATAEQLSPYLWGEKNKLFLQVSKVARFLVRDGTDIVIDPASHTDQNSIRLALMGSVFGALLFQRGNLVLHGNSVRIGDHCMVCIGHSGAGKSTLAAGLMQRGFEVLADDIVPVDAQCRALPGFPRIKLWQDAADQLNIGTQDLTRILPDMDKFNYPLQQRAGDMALPIRWIYILNCDQREDIQLGSITGMHRLQYLYDHTYRVRFFNGLFQGPQYLQHCSQLAGQIRLVRITRPSTPFCLDAVIDRILLDVHESNPSDLERLAKSTR